MTYPFTRSSHLPQALHLTQSLSALHSRALATVVALALATALLGTTGCAQIPAGDDVLPQQDLARAQLAAGIKLGRDGWPQAQWWTRFGDAQLDQLITRALKDSPSLQVAAARVTSARAALQLDRADQDTDVELKGAINRQRYSANGLLPPPIGGSYYAESTLQVVASHDFDWWGKRRALIAASLGEVNARQADYAQAEQTLAAVIAQNYFTLQAGWARLANLEQVRVTQRALVADNAKRIAHGLASSDELRTAEAALNALNKQYALIDTQNMREREALRALLGADSSALADLTPRALPRVSGALPTSLGIELLARRPDLQAARARVDASLNRIESTQAAFYPAINLTGFFGADSLSLETLLQAPSRTLFIGPTLTLPLFNSARLQARLGAARSQRNELIADYNQTVFNAVRDVAQAGVGLQGLEKQSREQAAATETAHAILRSTQARFKQGLVDNASILNAETAVLEQRDMDLQLQAQGLLAEVVLIKALGGGYRTQDTVADVASARATRATARSPEQHSK